MPGSNASDKAPKADAVATASDVLAHGGIVVYPTETLYALGADASNPMALQRLTDLKVRQPGKPIAVVISDIDMLRTVVADVPIEAELLMRRFWPGPLTLVLRALPSVSPLLTSAEGIGVRVSSHPLAMALVRALGRPVTAPSANPAGMRAPVCIDDARAYFGGRIDYYLNGGTLRGEPPSTVLDVRAGLQVIREGAIAIDAIRATLAHRPDAEDGEEPSISHACGRGS